MTWHKLAFYREDLWCPVIPQADKAYADFWRATLVDEKGKRSTEIRLGDIIELHGLPFNSFVVLRLVDYLVEQLQYIHVLDQKAKSMEVLCVKPCSVKNILGNIQDGKTFMDAINPIIRKTKDGSTILDVTVEWPYLTNEERDGLIKNVVTEKLGPTPKKDVNIDSLVQSCKEVYPFRAKVKAVPMTTDEAALRHKGYTVQRVSPLSNDDSCNVYKEFKVFDNDRYAPKRYTTAVLVGTANEPDTVVAMGDVVTIRINDDTNSRTESEAEAKEEESKERDSKKKSTLVRGTVYMIREAELSVLEHADSSNSRSSDVADDLRVIKGIAAGHVTRVVRKKAFFFANTGDHEWQRLKEFLCKEKGEEELWRWISEGETLDVRGRRRLLGQMKRATITAQDTAEVGETDEEDEVNIKGLIKERKPRTLSLARDTEEKRQAPLLALEGGAKRPVLKPSESQSELIGEVKRLVERITSEEKWEAAMDGYGEPSEMSAKKVRVDSQESSEEEDEKKKKKKKKKEEERDSNNNSETETKGTNAQGDKEGKTNENDMKKEEEEECDGDGGGSYSEEDDDDDDIYIDVNVNVKKKVK